MLYIVNRRYILNRSFSITYINVNSQDILCETQQQQQQQPKTFYFDIHILMLILKTFYVKHNNNNNNNNNLNIPVWRLPM